MATESKLEALARQAGKSPLQFLAGQFYEHGSITAVARALEVSPSTVRYWMMTLDVAEKSVLVLRSTGFQLTEKGRQMIKGGKS
jgi:transposase-like protein